MITRIVKIGDALGICIPEIILQQSGLRDEVELEVRSNHLIIKPKQGVREGWDDAFRLMAKNGDDRLLDGDSTMNQWEQSIKQFKRRF